MPSAGLSFISLRITSARSDEFYIGKAGTITATEIQRKEDLEFLEELLSEVRRESILQIKNSIALLNTAK